MPMWARIVEIVTGLCLMAGPSIPGGAAVVLLAAISFYRPLRRAHLLSIFVSLWIVGRGFLSADPASAEAQIQMLAGLLILMLSIVPSESNLPPPSWRRIQQKE